MRTAPSIAYVDSSNAVWVKITPQDCYFRDNLPPVTAHHDPQRLKERRARRDFIWSYLRVCCGRMGFHGCQTRTLRESSDNWGLHLHVRVSGGRVMTARQAERYLEGWAWHNRGWAVRGDGRTAHNPFRPRLRHSWEVEREKARRWDGLQARKRRQRESKAQLNLLAQVPVSPQVKDPSHDD